jgi:DNA-binding transcriptional regulator YiaG
MIETKCDRCFTGQVVKRDLANYRTKVKGVELTIPIAHLRVCENCGAIYVPGKELRRWNDLMREQDPLKTPSPEEICRLRERLRMSVNEFATFLRSTRQSVYSWENSANVIKPIGPIAVLLALIQASLEMGSIDVVAMLKAQGTSKNSGDKLPCRSWRGREGNRLRPIEDYRAVLMLPASYSPKKLPGLR